MKTMYIGSADVLALLSGLQTKTHHKLLKRFVSDKKPYYNAKASPIDALRTGAIIEERYGLITPDDFYPQFVKVYEKMDVLKCSLDFAQIEGGKVINFEELKSCSFNDFLEFEKFRDDPNAGIDYIRKRYKANYNQVQEQLLCTELDSAYIVFVAVYTYDDEINYHRDIKPNEIIKFKIKRDEEVISKIINRAEIFQTIKNIYK